MLNPQRLSGYILPGGSARDSLSGITPGQYRRMRHKQYSRKTHQHIPGEIPACQRCKPGWKPARLRRPEAGA